MTEETHGASWELSQRLTIALAALQVALEALTSTKPPGRAPVIVMPRRMEAEYVEAEA